MTLPFALPPWLPWWVAVIVLVLAALYGLAFLAMPFSVLGLKGRLDGLEARLDELQAEIRAVALRLPERGMYLSEAPRPPIPPAGRPQPRPREAPRQEPDLRPAVGAPEPPRPRLVEDPPPPDPEARPHRPLRAGRDPARPAAGEPRRTPPRLDWPR